MARIILFTGKGGVGKTTMAAATSLLSSEIGYITLIMSSDLAHSLSDAFEIKLANEPVKIKDKLYGVEIDPYHELETHWKEIHEYLVEVLNFLGLEDTKSEEIAVLSGMDELCCLLKLKEYYDSGKYDVVIIDCAPTGETLRLLSAPEVIRWYMRNLFPIQRKVTKLVGPIVKSTTRLPYPEDEVFSSTEKLYSKIGELKKDLSDDSVTSIRIVLNLEKMVIKEAQRSYTYFNLFNFPVDLVVVNRLISESIKDPYFEKWKVSQKKYLNEVEEIFSPLPIFKSELFEQEVCGLELLRRIGKMIYGDNDPVRIFYKGKSYWIKKSKKGYSISIKVPFVKKDELNLIKRGQELVIHARNWRRNMFLPRYLATLKVSGANFDGNFLNINFRG